MIRLLLILLLIPSIAVAGTLRGEGLAISDTKLTIDSTGLLTTADDLIVNGANIGITADPDLIELQTDNLDINGTLSVEDYMTITSNVASGDAELRLSRTTNSDDIVIRFRTGTTDRWLQTLSGGGFFPDSMVFTNYTTSGVWNSMPLVLTPDGEAVIGTAYYWGGGYGFAGGTGDTDGNLSIDGNLLSLDSVTGLSLNSSGGTINAGIADTVAGTIYAHGGAAAVGGTIYIDNGDTKDGTINGYNFTPSTVDGLSLILTSSTGTGLFNVNLASGVSSPNITGTSNVYVGTVDTTTGGLYVYGNNGTVGGTIAIYNPADWDAAIDYYYLRAGIIDGNDLELCSSSNAGQFVINLTDGLQIGLGIALLGTDDAFDGDVYIYGDGATDGAVFRLYNAANEDTTVDYYEFNADGTTLNLTGAGTFAVAGAGSYGGGYGSTGTTLDSSGNINCNGTITADGGFTGTASNADTVDGSHASAFQPVDTELTAIAGLVSAADRLPYFDGAGSAALATFTTTGRSIVDDASTSAVRTTLGIDTDDGVQFGGIGVGTAWASTFGQKIVYNPTADSSAQGLYISSAPAATATSRTFYGQYTALTPGTGTYTSCTFNGISCWVGGGSGTNTIPEVNVFYPGLDLTNANQTINTAYLLKLNTNTDASPAVVTNLYGVYIHNITAGSTLNYAIYTNSGAVRFGDAVTSTSTITGTTVTGTTSIIASGGALTAGVSETTAATVNYYANSTTGSPRNYWWNANDEDSNTDWYLFTANADFYFSSNNGDIMYFDDADPFGVHMERPLFVNAYVATPSAVNSVVAATGLTSAMCNSYTVLVESSTAGNCDISANPQIADGYDGQFIKITGTSDTKTVQFDDGNGLELPYSITLGIRDHLLLQYFSTWDLWVYAGNVNNS